MDIRIRRVQPGDAEALANFYSQLSPDTLRQRFLGNVRGIDRGVSRSFCALDHMHDEGFVAIVGEQQIVGHVCLVNVAAHAIEIGIAVSDAYQGRGIGRRLFETAIMWARDRGVERILASCFADNSRVLALLTSSAHGGRIVQAGSGVVDVEIPLIGPLPGARFFYPRVARQRRRVSRASRFGASPRTRPPARAAVG
jgi:GNAT superfamily N-acetyltransferase